MGCDIHVIAERRYGDDWERISFSPFDWRSYNMFAFLAGVRNYSAITPISEPRGLPADFDRDGDPYVGDHSFSWLSVEELEAFDYDQTIKLRRPAVEPGKVQVTMTTYRRLLGESFFRDLAAVKTLGAVRIVFGFDS
jgi:hypothetical protein